VGGARRALTERALSDLPDTALADLPDTDLPQTQNGEGHADERQLVDDDQRRGVVRADQIAHVGSERPRATGSGSGNLRVLEIEAGRLDYGLVRLKVAASAVALACWLSYCSRGIGPR